MMLRFVFAGLIGGGIIGGHGWAAEPSVAAKDNEDISFNRDIRPILADRCFFCHGFDKQNRAAELRLDVREAAVEVLSPNSPDDSELLRRITSSDPYEVMPPPEAHKKPVTEAEADLLRRWIKQGAAYENHWAFVSPKRPAAEVESIADAIDHLIAKRHHEQNLSFAKPTEPTKWLRRAALDLTGLPPTADELKTFANAVETEGETAYERAVDRLLASPHYGERLALEWLDVARYADTNGFQTDAYRMNWPWRDWVVRAFNANMPFDQFTIEQLAGDLLPNPEQEQLIATAFNRNHMINGEGGSIREENLAKNNFDRVETVSTAFLGLTVGCSQCHDHKFDPIRQTDYYSLMSFFNQIDESGMTSRRFNVKPDGQRYQEVYAVDRPFIPVSTPELDEELNAGKKLTAEAREQLEKRRDEFTPLFVKWVEEMRANPELALQRIKGDYVRRNVNTADLSNPKDGRTRRLLDYYLDTTKPWSDLRRKIKTAEAAEAKVQAKIPLVMIMRDDKPRDTFVMLRGNYETLGDKVTPGVPEFLPPLSTEDGERADRLTLARWLVSEEHPLTARVTVNRYWQMIFGRGLVTTPDDFGLQGALPTHPELLDWLAVEFRESGWDLKRLLRGMVLSRTYRQSAVVTEKQLAADPENKFFARGNRHRLDSRLLRDQALALSGLLVPELKGPPVSPYQPPGIWEPLSLYKNHYVQDHGDDLYRRSLYTVWRRVVAPANFFDVPSRQTCSVAVSRTSTPLHALTTLNDTTYVEAARVWASRLEKIDGDRSKLADAFLAATGRQPEPIELDHLHTALDRYRKRFADDPDSAEELLTVGESERSGTLDPIEHAAWTNLLLLILNLDETLSE